MALLFRPWAQPGETLNQDSTISTTTTADLDIPLSSIIKTEAPSLDEPREIKFKNVKEHVRKRSEKKNKRLRHAAENLPHTERKEAHPCVAPTLPSSLLPLSPMAFPLFDPVNGVSFKDCWDDLAHMSPELLDAAFAHGLPPNLIEEYARLLTEQQRQISERTRKQRPKKFRCPHCHVGFSNNGQLKGHIRIHTGERPFKCDAEQCGKSFTRNEELTRHRRIHSGLRPFPCSECGKRFGRKDHLKKHVRTHYQQRYQLVPVYPSQFPFLFGL